MSDTGWTDLDDAMMAAHEKTFEASVIRVRLAFDTLGRELVKSAGNPVSRWLLRRVFKR